MHGRFYYSTDPFLEKLVLFLANQIQLSIKLSGTLIQASFDSYWHSYQPTLESYQHPLVNHLSDSTPGRPVILF